MNKKEIKARIGELLSSGTPKAEIFAQLSGQGIKDRLLAIYIACYPDSALFDRHRGKVKLLVAIMLAKAVIVFLQTYYILGEEFGPNAELPFVAFLIASIELLFARGFYTKRVGAYDVYVLLSILSMRRLLVDFSLVGIIIKIGIITYVIYVRWKILPKAPFLAIPRKVKGQYVFVD
ncbi:MAG: hypothetical protein LBV45_06350 [Xanthomonadaceae bacterium]|jgi:hypothetical protein|nr:hypothetical protein [Xanthomonadaceae bacterium]